MEDEEAPALHGGKAFSMKEMSPLHVQQELPLHGGGLWRRKPLSTRAEVEELPLHGRRGLAPRPQ